MLQPKIHQTFVHEEAQANTRCRPIEGVKDVGAACPGEVVRCGDHVRIDDYMLSFSTRRREIADIDA